MPVHIKFADDDGLRKCSGCTLCCKLLPVHDGAEIDLGGATIHGRPPLHKPAGERCRYQRNGKGCTVYGTRKMPACCRMWTCRWLTNEDTADLSRPDRSRYVIDVIPDYVTIRPPDGGDDIHIQVVQVWVDPAHRDAHRDPALRRFLERRGKEGIAAMIRFGSGDGFVLIPPAMAADGQFHECVNTSVNMERTHSFADVIEKLTT